MIRSLRFDDLLLERALDDAGKDSDEFAQADASFVLMIPTFREFIPQLLEALGGEESPQGIDGAYNEPEPAPGAGIDVTKALGMRDGITATLHIPRANGPGDDPLLKEAIRFVRETRRASISAIQRKLKIGYNRAARLVEEIYRRADEGRRISRGSVVKSPPPRRRRTKRSGTSERSARRKATRPPSQRWQPRQFAIQQRLTALENKGHIQRDPKVARSIRPL